MPLSHDESLPATLEAEVVFCYCLHEVQAIQRTYPAISALDTGTLLWSLTQAMAHAIEIASRVFGAVGPIFPQHVAKRVGALLQNPTPTLLYELWDEWRLQHAGWNETKTLQVPVFFLLCQMNQSRCLREVIRRTHLRPLPVMKAWAGLVGNSVDSHRATQNFFHSMSDTLMRTLGRQLSRTEKASREGAFSPMADKEHDAFLGAVERKRHGTAGILALMIGEGSITTDSGQVVGIPSIPPLPVYGMECADGLDILWRANAKEKAIKVLAEIAPGILGFLETALPDAAHAAQRAEIDHSAAKKRGGSGGRKASEAGTVGSAAVHVPLGDPQENPGYIDPETLLDNRLDPQQQMEAQEEQAQAQKDADRAMRAAIERWGPSGERMMEALAAGKSDKEAAKAAGISPPAMCKRRKVLIKLLQP